MYHDLDDPLNLKVILETQCNPTTDPIQPNQPENMNWIETRIFLFFTINILFFLLDKLYLRFMYLNLNFTFDKIVYCWVVLELFSINYYHFQNKFCKHIYILCYAYIWTWVMKPKPKIQNLEPNWAQGEERKF